MLLQVVGWYFAVTGTIGAVVGGAIGFKMYRDDMPVLATAWGALFGAVTVPIYLLPANVWVAGKRWWYGELLG